MFHDLLALLMECVFLSIISIASSSISFVEIPRLIFRSTQLNYGVDILFCGSRVKGRFFLLVARSTICKSNMSLCLLWGTIKFMIVYLFLILAFSILVECVLTPIWYDFFFLVNNPRIQKCSKCRNISITCSKIVIVKYSNL
jgi:hypothetical protein